MLIRNVPSGIVYSHTKKQMSLLSSTLTNDRGGQIHYTNVTANDGGTAKLRSGRDRDSMQAYMIATGPR